MFMILLDIYAAIGSFLGTAAFFGARQDEESVMRSFLMGLALFLFWPVMCLILVIALATWAIKGD